MRIALLRDPAAKKGARDFARLAPIVPKGLDANRRNWWRFLRVRFQRGLWIWPCTCAPIAHAHALARGRALALRVKPASGLQRPQAARRSLMQGDGHGHPPRP